MHLLPASSNTHTEVTVTCIVYRGEREVRGHGLLTTNGLADVIIGSSVRSLGADNSSALEEREGREGREGGKGGVTCHLVYI